MTFNNSVSEQNHRWSQYGWVLAGILIATLIRFPIQPLMRDAAPFLFYLPVVLVVAIAFGKRLGLLATILSVLPANYFWIPPENSFALSADGIWHILGFSLTGFSISWLSEAGRRRKELEGHLRATLASVGDAIVTTDCCGRIVYLNPMAQVLTGLQGPEATGHMLGSALTLFAEDGRHVLNGTFQVAVNNDDIESLPRRLIISSKTGTRHHVEQKTSRILDATGRKLGIAILFHQLEPCLDRRLVLAPTKNEEPLNAVSQLPRIAIISTHGYVAARPCLGAVDTGGQIVYVLELSRKLAQLGYEVDIWTRQFKGQPEIESLDRRTRIIRVPCGGQDFIPKERLYEYLPEWNEKASQFIRKHRLKYEFINSHYWDGGLAGQYLSRVLGVPHIHTPHSLGIWKKHLTEADSNEDSAKLDEQYNFTKRISNEKQLYAAADMVVATSPQQQEILLRDYGLPSEKCRMIPPGYDDTRFFPVGDSTRQAIRKRLGFNTPVVQAIGRLADNKGYELLIKAFAVVSQRMPEATLYLAIGGETLTPRETSIFVRLRALAGELGLTGKVNFRGFIPDDQLADYYRAADVFVLSSRYEPFGMTAVEAMACGTPTVLTIHGGLHQAVNFGQHGLYADPFDPEDLGMMILKAVRDPRVRAQLSVMGAQKARSLFTWTGVAQEFVALAGNKQPGLQPARTVECN